VPASSTRRSHPPRSAWSHPNAPGMASGINSTLRQVGIATGVAALGSILTSSIRSSVMDQLQGGPLASSASHLAPTSVPGASRRRSRPRHRRYAPTSSRRAETAFASALNQILLVTGDRCAGRGGPVLRADPLARLRRRRRAVPAAGGRASRGCTPGRRRRPDMTVVKRRRTLRGRRTGMPIGRAASTGDGAAAPVRATARARNRTGRSADSSRRGAIQPAERAVAKIALGGARPHFPGVTEGSEGVVTVRRGEGFARRRARPRLFAVPDRMRWHPPRRATARRVGRPRT